MALLEMFEYEPLPDQPNDEMIRLMNVPPGQEAEDVQCQIKRFALADAPDYTALSYCWGDAGKKRAIMCIGARLDVTMNLHSALKHIREKGEVGWLWWTQSVLTSQMYRKGINRSFLCAKSTQGFDRYLARR